MSRKAGRQGRLYAGISSGGTAEPIAFLSKWALSSARLVRRDVDG